MRAEIERWASSRRWPDATASRCASLLVGCEKTTGVAIHTSSATACWLFGAQRFVVAPGLQLVSGVGGLEIGAGFG